MGGTTEKGFTLMELMMALAGLGHVSVEADAIGNGAGASRAILC